MGAGTRRPGSPHRSAERGGAFSALTTPPPRCRCLTGPRGPHTPPATATGASSGLRCDEAEGPLCTAARSIARASRRPGPSPAPPGNPALGPSQVAAAPRAPFSGRGCAAGCTFSARGCAAGCTFSARGWAGRCPFFRGCVGVPPGEALGENGATSPHRGAGRQPTQRVSSVRSGPPAGGGLSAQFPAPLEQPARQAQPENARPARHARPCAAGGQRVSVTLAIARGESGFWPRAMAIS
jgi:hypothetical protein